MTEAELKRLLPRASKSTIAVNVDKWPDSEYDYENHPDTQLQDPKPKRNQTPALGAATAREIEGALRVVVRFIGYRARPLDPDNFAGGCKDLLDCLRHAGLIRGDEPWRIDLQTWQEKVAHRTQEKTVIEIVYPGKPPQ